MFYAATMFIALSAFPAGAQAALRDAVDEAQLARNAYHAKLGKVREALLARLEQQLRDATKRGDLDGALEVKKEIARVRDSDFVTLMEDIMGSARQLAATEQALLGRWAVQLVKDGRVTYASEWTFSKNGLVTSSNPGGALRGTWQAELGEGRVRVNWSADAWETLVLPLKPEGVTGSSWSGAAVQAKKVK
jgi:hypothetical protein